MSKHRSDRQLTPAGRSKQRSLSALLIVVGVLLLVTTVIVGVFFAHNQQQAPAMVRPSTTSTLPTIVSPGATFGPTVPAKTSTSAAPMRVSGSLPVRLEVPRLNFRVQVIGNWLGSPIDPPFDPDTADEVAYFDTSRGVRPGSHASNSSYFAGHTCRGEECQSAFDVLDQNLRVGDDIFLTTVASERQNLRLHYVVTADNLYPRNSLPEADEVWAVIPNRLVFITCNLRVDGAEQTDNHVFFAEYVGLG